LGHRYGSRPTPATIRASLFEQLYRIIYSDMNKNEDAQLLSQWYQLDTNQMPATYILRPISSILPEILSTVKRRSICNDELEENDVVFRIEMQ
jgi:hypothetical protein